MSSKYSNESVEGSSVPPAAQGDEFGGVDGEITVIDCVGTYNGVGKGAGLVWWRRLRRFETEEIMENLSDSTVGELLLEGEALSWFNLHRAHWRDEFVAHFAFNKETAWFWLHNPVQAEGMSVREYLEEWHSAASLWPGRPVKNAVKRWLLGVKDPVAQKIIKSHRESEPVSMEGMEEWIEELAASDGRYSNKVFRRPFKAEKVRKKLAFIHQDSNMDQ